MRKMPGRQGHFPAPTRAEIYEGDPAEGRGRVFVLVPKIVSPR